MCHSDYNQLDTLRRGPHGTQSRHIGFKIPFEEHEQLRLLAEREGVQISALLRRMILATLDQKAAA
jgi:hypothetical protein